MIKKHFNKEFVITKRIMKILRALVCVRFLKILLSMVSLRPSHYLSVTGLNWDAMLDMTKV